MKFLLIRALLLLSLFPTRVQAQALVPTVQWSQTPLWKEELFYPGSRREAVLTVSNSDSAAHVVSLEINDVKDGGLLSAIELSIENKPLSMTETNLLSGIPSGGILKIPLALVFNATSGNQYKGKNVSFLVCLRFEIGGKVCTPSSLETGHVSQSEDMHAPRASSGSSQTIGQSSVAQAIASPALHMDTFVKAVLTHGNQTAEAGNESTEQSGQGEARKGESTQEGGRDERKRDIQNSEVLGAVGGLTLRASIITAVACALVVMVRLIIA